MYTAPCENATKVCTNKNVALTKLDVWAFWNGFHAEALSRVKYFHHKDNSVVWPSYLANCVYIKTVASFPVLQGRPVRSWQQCLLKPLRPGPDSRYLANDIFELIFLYEYYFIFICAKVSIRKWVITGLYNVLYPNRGHAIIWTKYGFVYWLAEFRHVQIEAGSSASLSRPLSCRPCCVRCIV